MLPVLTSLCSPQAEGVLVALALCVKADFCSGLSVSRHLCCQIKCDCKEACYFSFVQIIYQGMNSVLRKDIFLWIFEDFI